MAKKILFFPIEVGIAHIARSLAIAEKLLQDGHDIYFALPKRKQSLYSSSPVKFIDIPGLVEKDSMQMLSYFKDTNRIRKYVTDELKLVKSIQPDIIFVDFRISALVTVAVSKIPAYFITGSSWVPFGGYIPNIGLPDWLHKLAMPVLNKWIWKTKKIYIDTLVSVAKEYNPQITFSDLVDGPTYIIPESSEYLPYLRPNLKIQYIGPLHWKGFQNEFPKWLSDIHPNGKTIYISFGGTGFDKKKLIQLSTRLSDKGYTVIVSASSIAQIDEFPIKKNLYVSPYLPGLEISKRVDLVICHGGIGTLMHALLAKKPTVSIPFNPDQFIHGLRFKELGLGKIVMKPSLTTILKITQGKLISFEELGKNTEIDNIISHVEEILENPIQYKNSIHKWSKNLTDEHLNLLSLHDIH
ncbi:MAG: glycosyltransferase [bacterium]|nr:glycosyltransferase [bacterium]